MLEVNFLPLLLAVALLWLPRQWLRRGALMLRRRKKRDARNVVEPWRTREPGDPRVNIVMEFRKFRNYLDLLRGAAGSLAFVGGMGLAPSLTAAAGAPRSAILQMMGIRAVVLLVGVLIQTVRWERGRLSFYPPIFFLAGVSVGLCDIRGAAFAFALICAFNTALPNAQGFLTLYAVLLVGFGHLFSSGGDLSAAFAGGLAFLPVLLSLLAKKPLTIMSRKATHAPGPA